jgi:hypothetical protein
VGFVDPAGDSAWLWETRMRRDIVRPRDVLAVLEVENRDGSWLTAEGARGLRDALTRVLGDDGSTHPPQESPQALHAAQHQQLEAAARRFAEHVDDQANALAAIAARTHEASATAEAVDVVDVAELLHLLAVQQQRTTASLGDLLSAIAGEP